MDAIKECIFHSGDVRREFCEEPFVEETILQRNEKFSRITGRRRSITGGYAVDDKSPPVAKLVHEIRAAASLRRRRENGGGERVERRTVPGPGL